MLSWQSASTQLRPATGMESLGCKVGGDHLSFAVYRYEACPILDIKICVNHNFVVLDSTPSVLWLMGCSYRFQQQFQYQFWFSELCEFPFFYVFLVFLNMKLKKTVSNTTFKQKLIDHIQWGPK